MGDQTRGHHLLIDHIFRRPILSYEAQNGLALERGREKAVKFLRVFLSLHSIQLILISALIMTYLAATAENRPAKTESVQGTSSTEEESAWRGDDGPLSGNKRIKAIISEAGTRGKTLEARATLETMPFPSQIITPGDEGVIAESFENEGATAAGQLLLNARATTLEP